MNLIRNPPEGEIQKLLSGNGLPGSDLSANHFNDFLGLEGNGIIHGVVGVEIYNSKGLLRSLAVKKADRNLGYGKRLVAEIEKYAREKKVQELYLLTTTAEDFFSRLGYAALARSKVPDVIRATEEFSELCPDSAVVMLKVL